MKKNDAIYNLVNLIRSYSLSLCSCDDTISPVEILVASDNPEYDIDIINPVKCVSCNTKSFLSNHDGVIAPKDLTMICNYVLSKFNCWCDVDDFDCISCDFKRIVEIVNNNNS